MRTCTGETCAWVYRPGAGCSRPALGLNYTASSNSVTTMCSRATAHFAVSARTDFSLLHPAGPQVLVYLMLRFASISSVTFVYL